MANVTDPYQNHVKQIPGDDLCDSIVSDTFQIQEDSETPL